MTVAPQAVHDATRETLPYESHTASTSDSSGDWIIRLVGPSKRVLVLRVATDTPLHALHDQECRIVAVAMNPQEAERVAPFCDRVLVGEIEHLDLLQQLGKDRFDLIVADGVFERLTEPQLLLQIWKQLLRPEGYILASVTNVAHASVRLALLGGRFPHGEGDLLDSSHLRFFTRDTVEKLFEGAGFAIGRLERQTAALDGSGPANDGNAVSADLLKDFMNDPDALTRQFIIIAYPLPHRMLGFIQRRMRELVVDNDMAQRKLVELEWLRERLTRQERGITLLRDVYQGEIARRERLTSEREKYVTEVEGSIATLKRALADREGDVAELLRNVHAQQVQLSEHAATIAAKDEHIADIVREKDRHITDLETIANAQRQQLEKLVGRLRMIEQEVLPWKNEYITNLERHVRNLESGKAIKVARALGRLRRAIRRVAG